MTTFNISNITQAGAFAKAVTAAQNSDRRNAGSHSDSGEGWQVTRFLSNLTGHIANTITTNNRRIASSLISRAI
jgi:hypothetical protein